MKALVFLTMLIVSTLAFSWSRDGSNNHIANQEQPQVFLELQRRSDQAELQKRQLEAADQERDMREAIDEALHEAEERARQQSERSRRLPMFVMQ